MIVEVCHTRCIGGGQGIAAIGERLTHPIKVNCFDIPNVVEYIVDY